MKRFLFVVPPFAGHVYPTLSVARELMTRGHRVAWAAHVSAVGALLPRGAEVFPLDGDADSPPVDVLQRATRLRGLASLRFLWRDLLVPLARATLPRVLDVLDAFAPDVVVSDHQVIAGSVAARKRGARFATFCTTSASILDPLADLPKVQDWIDDQIVGLQREAGIEPVPSADLSPDLVVVFSTEALIGSRRWPEHYRFVGPSIGARSDETPFPWQDLDDGRPRIFVSLGTISAEAGAHFYSAAIAAFRDVDVQVILAAPPALVPSPPANFIVRARVPQLALLARVDAVICHGGHNTVCEALAHGLPLVVAPIRDDQPVVAQQVVQAGAGLRVRYGRMSADSLRAAGLRVIREKSFRAAALRVRASFQEAGGAPAAADALMRLA